MDDEKKKYPCCFSFIPNLQLRLYTYVVASGQVSAQDFVFFPIVTSSSAESAFFASLPRVDTALEIMRVHEV